MKAWKVTLRGGRCEVFRAKSLKEMLRRATACGCIIVRYKRCELGNPKIDGSTPLGQIQGRKEGLETVEFNLRQLTATRR